MPDLAAPTNADSIDGGGEHIAEASTLALPQHVGNVRYYVADVYGLQFNRPASCIRSWSISADPVSLGTGLSKFQFTILNWRGAGEKVPIRPGRFELRDSAGGEEKALIATVNRSEIAPFDISSGDTITLQLLFELPVDADPLELEYDVLEYISYPRLGETIVYKFR